MEDLYLTESSWEVWIGPIVIGMFALVLIFLIRRFSLRGKNGSDGSASPE